MYIIRQSMSRKASKSLNLIDAWRESSWKLVPALATKRWLRRISWRSTLLTNCLRYWICGGDSHTSCIIVGILVTRLIIIATITTEHSIINISDGMTFRTSSSPFFRYERSLEFFYFWERFLMFWRYLRIEWRSWRSGGCTWDGRKRRLR